MMLSEIPTDRELTTEEWLAVEIPITPFDEQLEQQWKENKRLVHELVAAVRQNNELRATISRLLYGLPAKQSGVPINAGTFARRLCEARKAADLTQEQAAHAVGIGRSNLAMVETGRTTISDEHIRRLAALYKVGIGWLFGEI